MNILLLTSIILTIAPGRGQGGGFSGDSLTSNLASNKLGPCKKKSKDDPYEKFARRHIVKDRFDRNSMKEWEQYLKKKKLCGRTPIQSFIEAKDEINVKKICKQSGWRLKEKKKVPGNLCISMEKMMMYNVKSTTTKKGNCQVTKAKKDSQRNLPRNLCISTNKIRRYDVKSANSCTVTKIREVNHYVVVACNKVKNVCLPVHFVKYNKENHVPDHKTCQPSA